MRNYRVFIRNHQDYVFVGGYQAKSIKELRKDLNNDPKIKQVIFIVPEVKWPTHKDNPHVTTD